MFKREGEAGEEFLAHWFEKKCGKREKQVWSAHMRIYSGDDDLELRVADLFIGPPAAD